MCSSYGRICSFDLILNNQDVQKRPYAFVGYKRSIDAQNAIEAIRKRGFDGHRVAVDFARSEGSTEKSSTDQSQIASTSKSSIEHRKPSTTSHNDKEMKMRQIEAELRRMEREEVDDAREESEEYRWRNRLLADQTSGGEGSKKTSGNPLEKYLNAPNHIVLINNRRRKMADAQQQPSEGDIRTFKEFLNQYNILAEQCFMDCVRDFTTRQVSEKEETCAYNCLDKNLKMIQRISTRFQEYQMIQAEASGNAPLQAAKK